ncbi:DUF1206 domain-containing protein [Pontixanthobacter aestiaquae]|uniref:DUF1206 domain-containing protein n=1 Tax=Pontixanthobacter aestiaquae TaxID=1509367 RepID=A0A844Z6I9_9SPHN|nr:DUF1206 domain-containing protein [Pontixanthobacter aestiaquae]MDN3645476.1 DUF1206 domain-containing protein [Pontixanthobacter aestiaquae]MXO83525.1 DUF1206 domain-containing protein [Pontixanthobacter aestiaquae]
MVDKSEKFGWLVRLGYFSRAILYVVLGLIALTSAGRISQGTNGIFQAVEDIPAATAILWLMTLGLFGYALFRFASTFFDIENNGSDKKGWAKRIGHAGSGIGHLALAYTAYQFANSGSASGGGAQAAAAGVLSVEFGGVVLGLLGIAFFATAFFQAKKGFVGEFMHRISSDAPQATRWLGGFGYSARAVVYAVIGWSLFKAGFMSSGAEQVKTLGDALASLAGEGMIFSVTAIGLLVFGLFSLVLARYRVIPDLDSDEGIPSFRA